MPEYLSPGVYVEEVQTGPRPIEGVSTSTAGFVGQTERGSTKPKLVTSWPNYQRWYGGYIDPQISYLPYAIKGFFDNGGQRAFVARVVGPGADAASLDVGNLHIEAVGAGVWGNQVYVRVMPASKPDQLRPNDRFRLTVLYYANPPLVQGQPVPAGQNLTNPLDPRNPNPPTMVEDFDNLEFDEQRSNYVIATVNKGSTLLAVKWVDVQQPQRPPDTDASNQVFQPLANGLDNDGTAIGANEYLGLGQNGTFPPSTNDYTGLKGLEIIDEINLLCVPDHVHPNLQNNNTVTTEIITQCETLKDRFAILQTKQGSNDVSSLPDNVSDTTYGAIYHPWIRVFDPRIGDVIDIPSVGHVAGIYARTDIERGVHKAPANEVVRGIITQDLPDGRKPLEYTITKGEHDILNPKGVNVIRDFRSDGRGIRVWGARTLSSDSMWKYVNVRRLFLFIEESIDEGTQWVVFEPNYEPTWAAVRRSITNFLISVWRSGALMGTTQEEAFFVKCDRTTMTQDDIDNGRLICLIGVAPVKPAEFVIFRISQKALEAVPA